MTPRERAAAARVQAWDLARKRSMSRGVEHHELILALDECFAAAITEHVRALLADDEATIEMMARAAYGGEWHTRSEETQAGYIAEARAALAALRIKELGE